jgi:hypothetical protein
MARVASYLKIGEATGRAEKACGVASARESSLLGVASTALLATVAARAGATESRLVSVVRRPQMLKYKPSAAAFERGEAMVRAAAREAPSLSARVSGLVAATETAGAVELGPRDAPWLATHASGSGRVGSCCL